MRATLLSALFLLPAIAGDDEVEKRCAELSGGIEKLLGRKFKAPVPVRIVDEEFIVEFARRIEQELVPAEVLDVQRRLYERLRFIPKGYDLAAAQLDLLKVSIAGLYDPDKDCYYVVGDKARPGSLAFDVTAAHELAHAYRDVDKDYWARMVGSALLDEDRTIAVSCLAEGDAMLVGNVVGLKWETEAAIAAAKRAPAQVAARVASPMLKRFPLFLRELLLTRYLIGQAFAAHVYEKGGWPALAKAYDAPPVSTEQILHPAKYLGPKVDTPTRIEGGDPVAALGAGWKTSYSNTLGEFMIRVLVSQSRGRKAAAEVAAGWDGARFFVCERAGAPLFLGVVSVWDSEKDAQQFLDAWVAWTRVRDGIVEFQEVRIVDGDTHVVGGDLVVLRRVKNAVFIADGVPAQKAAAVMKSLAAAKLIP